MTTAFAPGKIILFGEHAVVYGRPAIAVPVLQVNAKVTIENIAGDRVHIDAPDIRRAFDLEFAGENDPIARIIKSTCTRLGIIPRGISIRIQSTIPVARGLGSGAAVSVAVARALAQHYGLVLKAPEASDLALQVEKLHHGTPSGIDNTTIAFGQAVYFIRDQAPEFILVRRPFQIAIADTGVKSSTKVAVGDVRRGWETSRENYERLFDQIGSVAGRARQAIATGDTAALGPLMNENQKLASEIGVSSPEIETLVVAALDAGAEGAKLSGAGRGGNIIALVNEDNRSNVERNLREHGAKNVILTRVE